MPIFAIPASGVLVSRQVASGDLTSGSVMVGMISSGAISSGGLGSGWISSGHIASGIYGGATADYWRQKGDVPALLVSNVYASGDATRGYCGGALPIADTCPTGNPSPKTVYVQPFAASKNLTVTRISALVLSTATSGTTCQLGIYDCKSDLWPNNLLYSTASTLPLWSGNSATGENESWALSGKTLYWLAYIGSSGASPALGYVSYPADIFGFSDNLVPDGIAGIAYSAPTSGTWPLPNPFPDASGTIKTGASDMVAVMINF